jgi:hypothetical protein
MGLTMEQSEQPTIEARPGPGTVVPKLLTLLGSGWVLWLTWSTSGRLVLWLPRTAPFRWRPRFAPLRAALAAVLGLTR